MITFDEIINAADSVSTNVPAIVMSTMSRNFMSTVSISFHNKKVRYKTDCYILQTVLLVVILLFIIVIICCHYTKHRSKQNSNGTRTI